MSVGGCALKQLLLAWLLLVQCNAVTNTESFEGGAATRDPT